MNECRFYYTCPSCSGWCQNKQPQKSCVDFLESARDHAQSNIDESNRIIKYIKERETEPRYIDIILDAHEGDALQVVILRMRAIAEKLGEPVKCKFSDKTITSGMSDYEIYKLFDYDEDYLNKMLRPIWIKENDNDA